MNPDNDQPPLTASRRSFLRGASTLGLAVAAFPAVSEVPAAAAAPPAQFLGSDQRIFKEIRSGETVKGVKYPGVPGLSGLRIYGVKPTGKHHETNHIAAHWPQPTPPPEPAHPGPSVYSIYPVPADVMSGQGAAFDAVKNLISTAPAGSYLTCWHEALSLKYPKYITSNTIYQLHARMNTLTKQLNPGLTYGAIFGGGDLTTLLHSAPPSLGFYGLDLYGNEGIDAGLNRLETFITLARKKDTVHGYPRIMLPECNSPINSQRPEWFKRVAKRMKEYGSNSAGILTFWNGKGTIGAKWNPTDKATIDAMNDVVKHIF